MAGKSRDDLIVKRLSNVVIKFRSRFSRYNIFVLIESIT